MRCSVEMQLWPALIRGSEATLYNAVMRWSDYEVMSFRDAMQ